MKIIDRINESKQTGRPFYSLEYFPPKTSWGTKNLLARMQRMGRLDPAFVSVTWGAGGSTADLTLDIVSHAQMLIGLESMMHLTCTNMPRPQLIEALHGAYGKHIRNVLALRGDPAHGSESWESCQDGLRNAVDLVSLIRTEFGDAFGIGVAGYPQGHSEAASYEQDLSFLKEKVDAGADFIITQLFFESSVFLAFVDDCRRIGIDKPIIPGIMPIHSYSTFQKVTRFCDVPEEITTRVESLKSNDEAVKEYGFDLVAAMCRELLDAGTPGLHFYTLNLEATVDALVRSLGLVSDTDNRALPWLPSHGATRGKEDVRPIFWANRPKSYRARTMEWDEFPNGRWGDSRSPAFGDLAEWHSTQPHIRPKRRRGIWGETIRSEQDVYEVFCRFIRGEIEAIPWFDQPLALESGLLRDALLHFNQHGLLTINSQPRVDGALSSDPAVGWGDQNGRVYQKAYLECFVSADDLPVLLEVLDAQPMITYQALNLAGTSFSNFEQVTAVTWGIFPGREVLQPTVVDPESFHVWKNEAFDLWTSVWGALYAEDCTSRRVLEEIKQTYFLVNVVDNDFVDGDLMAVLFEAVEGFRAARVGDERAVQQG